MGEVQEVSLPPVSNVIYNVPYTQAAAKARAAAFSGMQEALLIIALGHEFPG